MSSIWTDDESAAQDPFDPTRGWDETPGPQRAGAPETAAPETAAPETAAPETAETAAPETAAPAGDAPAEGGDGGSAGDGAARPGTAGRNEDGSFSDPTGAVHVRLAEGGLRVVGVRVSTRWRERLRRTDLATALRTACHRAQVSVPRRPPVASPDVSSPNVSSPNVSSPDVSRRAGASTAATPAAPRRAADRSRTVDWAGFNALLETTRALSEEAAERRARPAAERPVPTLTTPPAEGAAAAGQVRVVLAPAGQVREVHIDPQWADQSRITELTAALEQALSAAYDAWQPPQYELGEAGRLMARLSGHRKQLLDMIAGRG